MSQPTPPNAKERQQLSILQGRVRYQRELGNIDEAKRMASRAAELLSQWPADTPELADGYAGMAAIWQDLGDDALAEAAIVKALDLDAKESTPRPSTQGTHHLFYAKFLFERRRFNEAALHARKGVALYNEVYADTDRELQFVRQDMAKVIAAADAPLVRARDIDELRSKAMFLIRHKKDIDGARALAVEAEAMLARLQDTPSESGDIYAGVAGLWRELGEPDRAEPFIAEAIRIETGAERRRPVILGTRHLFYAKLLFAAKRFREAAHHAREGVSIYAEACAPDDKELAFIRRDVAPIIAAGEQPPS